MSPEFVAAYERMKKIVERAAAGKAISEADRAFVQRVKDANAPGRPRETDNSRLPIYSSMEQASAATGIPESLLKEQKKICPDAFPWNRVNLALFLRHYFTVGLHAGADPKRLRGEFQAANEKLKYERAAEKLVEKEPVQKALQAAEALFFGLLDRYFLSELPPQLAKKTPQQISKIAEQTIESLKCDLRSNLAAALKK